MDAGTLLFSSYKYQHIHVPLQAATMPTYKAMRAEWAKMDTVPDVFSNTLHVANLAPNFKSDATLKGLFESHGPVNHCRVATSKQDSAALCYAFVSFDRSDHCDAAFRALDGTTVEGVGTMVICFVNPCKFSDARQARLSAGGRGVGRGAVRGRCGVLVLSCTVCLPWVIACCG